MSIFKESFRPEIQIQIDKRQNLISQGDRTYFLQRQCTFRMASGVNIEGTSELAKNNILEGGLKTQDGKARSGFPGAYDTPSDGYGFVPMPGITSISVKTKTAYGSLREVIVNFECHNLNQLSLLEKLYMRPGYPCLVEWGWEPYISNNAQIITENNLPFISSNNNFWNGTLTQDSIQKEINKKKKDSYGNYDALFGIVKNFNYSVRGDGGYTCTTELIAIGEVIESLKGELSEENPTKHVLEKHLEDLNDYAYSLSEKSLSMEEVEDLFEEQQLAEGIAQRDLQKAIDKGIIYNSLTENAEVFKEKFETQREQNKKRLERLYIGENSNFKFKDLDLIRQQVSLKEDAKPSVFIRWKAFIKLINDSINQDIKGKKLTLIEAPNNILFNETKLNEEVKNKIINPFKKGGKYEVEGGETILNFDISINPQVCLFPNNVKEIFKDPNFKVDRQIGNIYFNVRYLYKTFQDQYYTTDGEGNPVNDDDFSLGRYIKRIWEDVNKSCGDIHNFQLSNNFEKNQTSRIIDLEFEKPPINTNIVNLNILGKKSIVRDFKYDLSIPSSLTATIAIAAQNADNPSSLEQVTFSAFNKGIKNRFFESGKTKKYTDGYKARKIYNVQKLTEVLVITEIDAGIGDNTNTILGFTGFAVEADSQGQDDLFRLSDLLIELKIYLERLKGTNTQSIFTTDIKGKYSNNEIISTKSSTKFLNQVNQDFMGFELKGSPYVDFDEIPSSDISKIRTILKSIIKLNRDLQRYNLNDFSLKTNNPNITTIIPLKFSAKLDGISNIIIGNIFKIQESKLPELYKDNRVAFIVTGEEQSIDGQDWTTTITGQTVLLPI